MHLDATLIVPLDNSTDGFPLIQDHDHGRAGLHLLKIIEIFGIGLFGWRWLLPLHACAHLVLYIRQSGTDQSSIHIGLLLKPEWTGKDLSFSR